MPRTGRPPLPTALKIAKGERRASRLNADEPDLPVARGLDPPDGLVGAGLKEWIRGASMLAESGVLKEPDMPAMEDYCRRLTDLRALEAELVRMRKIANQVEEAKEVDLKTLVSAWSTIDTTARRLLLLQALVNTLRREIGLTPSSRSAVKVQPKKPNEDTGKNTAARYMSAIRGGRA